MPDRYAEAARYKAQTFWPIPCNPGSKKAAVLWAVYERRVMTTQEMHAAWPPKSNNNIALVLGPLAHLLVLNVNMKHGHNGLRSLNGYTIPATPTILTPHHGFAYLFCVPNHKRYPCDFKNHPTVQGHPGIELRGAGGYQLVPSSTVVATVRDPAGDYQFVPGWTLERLMSSLVPPPDWLLELWIAADRGAKISREILPAISSQSGKPASAAALPTDLSSPSHPSPQQRSCLRPAPQTTTKKQELLTSGARARTTVLSASGFSRFRGTFAYGCALHLLRMLGQPGAWLENKHTFHCLLPGHGEATPSARWMWQDDGSLLYHDLHARTEHKLYWAVPEVYAAFITGTLVSFGKHKPSMKTWSIRLAVDAGLTEPYPLAKPAMPADAPPLAQRLLQGIWLLFACKWTYEAEKATMLGRDFVAGWCGMPSGSVWLTMQWVLSRHILMPAGYEKRCPVYLPGSEWSW